MADASQKPHAVHEESCDFIISDKELEVDKHLSDHDKNLEDHDKCDNRNVSVSDQNEEKASEYTEYTNPVDHGWSWVIVVGVFGICMLSIGALKSFGVLYVEMEEKYQVSSKALSSVQSVTGFLYLGLGPISNALSLRFTHRVVTFSGGVLAAMGMFLSAFAPVVEVLYITYGVITGCGMGLCFSPSIVVLAFYFKNRRSLATGLALSGGGLGAMILPYIIRYLLSEYNLQGAFMIYAGIFANICVFASLLRPYQHYPKKRILTSDETKQVEVTLTQCEVNNLSQRKAMNVNVINDLDEKRLDLYCVSNSEFIENPVPQIDEQSIESQTQVTEVSQSNNAVVQSMKCEEKITLLTGENERKNLLNLPAISRSSLNQSLSVLTAVSCQDIRALTEKSQVYIQKCEGKHEPARSLMQKLILPFKHLDWKLFKNPEFVLMFVMIFFAMIGYHSLFNIIPPFAEEIGLSGTDGAFILFIFGLGDLIGRASIGWLMDCVPTKKIVIYTICVLCCAVGVVLTPQFRTLLGLCVFMSSYSICAGGFNATVLVIVVDSIGLEKLPSAFGFMCFAVAIAMLLNPLVSGAIKDGSGTWANAFRFTGSVSCLAVVLLLVQLILQKRLAHHKKLEDESNK